MDIDLFKGTNDMKTHIDLDLPQEIESGNIEYKRILTDKSLEKIENRVSQMKWRLAEGNGIAYYLIGIDDDGSVYGITKKELNYSKKILNIMAKRCDAKISIVKELEIDRNKYTGHYKISLIKSNRKIDEIRIAFLGNSLSGKSTLISTLLNGESDNGNGTSRLNIFKHKHEIYSGNTSCITTEIIGFKDNKLVEPCNIYKTADKIISLIDLPGHDKYMKTTIFGQLAYYPNYICFIIDITEIDENINLNFQINLNNIIILTKCDLVSNEYIEQKKNYIQELYKDITIFTISCVSLTGIDELLKYFSNLENTLYLDEKKPIEFIINDILYKPDIGLIMSGILLSGIIKINDTLQVGYNTFWKSFHVKSIHRFQEPFYTVYPGNSCTIVTNINKNINITRNMVINTRNIYEYNQNFKIIINNNNNNNFKIGCNLILYHMNIIEICCLNNIENNILDISIINKSIHIKDNEPIILRYNNIKYYGTKYLSFI
jgi:elongation factor 1-alpha